MNNPSLGEILDRIRSLRHKAPKTTCISIDGPAGSGKTTLAKRIAQGFDDESVAIIHMDDLYNGWEDALSPQLTRTLVNQILTPISLGKTFGYRKFDWLSKRFMDYLDVSLPSLLILEGVGSGQKATRKFTDELIWIEVDHETGLQRVLRRDGDYLETEMRVWQIREQEHFKVENTRDCATIRLDGNFFI